jgi:uncharacterized membrane-anchored protein YhcB (DUF1043 family)
MIQRLYKANKESIILLSKKLASEMRRESLEGFMIAAAKARLLVLKTRENQRVEKEQWEKEEFERKKKEVEEMKKDYENRSTELMKREMELSYAKDQLNRERE